MDTPAPASAPPRGRHPTASGSGPPSASGGAAAEGGPRPAPLPAGEVERLAALRRYRVLDTPEEEAFDRLVRLARELFDAEVANVSLVDAARQWLKAHAGPPGGAPGAREVPRSWSFCAYAVLDDGVFVVPDARADARFRTNPLVVGAPGIRFYAGAPLRTPDGHNLGALCVLSPEPRGGFSAEDRRRLRSLADMAVSELELRLHARRAEEARAALEAEMAERARAEAALREAERLAALGRLAGGLAHDVNNVLQAVAGAAGLLRRRAPDAAPDATRDAASVERLAGVIAEAAGRGASITRRMVAFARCDALRPSPAEAGALVEGLAELIRCTAGPGVAVEVDAGGGRWAVLCDADGLGRALLDLAANARDAMPGGGTLALSVRDVRLGEADVAGQDGAGPGDWVEVAVRDTGAGMDEATRARAFEPFFTTKPVGRGTGLGLSQVHGFARQSGGFARLDSAPGRGTTARIFLPRHRGAAPDAAPPAAVEAPARL